MIKFKALIVAVLIFGASSAVLAKDWSKKKTDDAGKLTKSEEVMSFDFIKFARARGLPSQRIVRFHLLPNILIPIITVLAIEFGTLIAFATVTETIFAWPGLGKLVIDAIVNLDRPIVVAYLMFVVTLFLILNLIVDILYAVLDPRVRVQGEDQ